jgi:ornithine--oxo-acid transaminase
VRGLGLFCGIAFRPPTRARLRAPYMLFEQAHAGLFGQMIVRALFARHHILTQVCGNNFRVLKVAPPLVVQRSSLDRFVAAIRDVMEEVHTSRRFWSDALALAGRALRA